MYARSVYIKYVPQEMANLRILLRMYSWESSVDPLEFQNWKFSGGRLKIPTGTQIRVKNCTPHPKDVVPRRALLQNACKWIIKRACQRYGGTKLLLLPRIFFPLLDGSAYAEVLPHTPTVSNLFRNGPPQFDCVPVQHQNGCPEAGEAILKLFASRRIIRYVPFWLAWQVLS
jgi:hypothetical protein